MREEEGVARTRGRRSGGILILLGLAALGPGALAGAAADPAQPAPAGAAADPAQPAPTRHASEEAPAVVTPAARSRPRIGLALSGGGARGLAHVGVLRALEELRVPVDCIAGTSMGAIVGGLYASGLSPAQIEEAMEKVDWVDLFNDRPPRADLSYRRKQDDSSDFIDFELGLKGGRVVLPRGLIAGQKIGFLLQSITLRSAAIDDFDRLPIPFRAVATDLGSGTMVVLSRGDLAEALRASMSLPGTLAPVEMDGRLLVDGGLVRNLPVDVARGMGADVVIAVDVSTPLDPAGTIQTVADVTRQVTGMMTRENVEAQTGGADLLIQPDLSVVSSMGFARSASAVTRGEDAARAQRDALRRYAVPDDEFAARLAQVRPSATPAPIRIDAVRVEGTTRVDRRTIERKIRTRAGQTLDLDTLKGDLSRLYDLGDFERIDYRLVPTERGTDLVLRTREKSWGPNYLRFGLNFVNDLEGDSDYSVLARYTRTRMNPLGAEWRNDVRIGRTRLLASEFFQPLDYSGRWFVAPGFQYNDRFFNDYEEDRLVAEYDVEGITGALDFGAELGRYGEVRAGAIRGRVRASARTGASGLPHYNLASGGWTAHLVIDRLDNPYFPARGRFGLLDLFLSRRDMGADLSYDKLLGSYAQVLSRGRHRVYMSLTGGTNLGSDVPFYDNFTLGGFFSLSGFKENQLRGQVFGVARLGYYVKSGGLSGRLGRGVYVGGWVEAGNAWATNAEVNFGDLIYTGTLAVGSDTFFGPIYLAYGHSDDGHSAFYLSIGRSFAGSNASIFRSY
jgi:NTE family protein